MLNIISEGARVSSVVMPSFGDEAAHFGDKSINGTIERYKELGATCLAVKDGAAGATLDFHGKRAFVPAAEVGTVVDTTSAGDSFNGAFLAHYVTTGDVVAAAHFATNVAGRVICEHGALVAL